MNIKNKQRAKLVLAELEKEMEILTKEEANVCKGGYHCGEIPGLTGCFVPLTGFEGQYEQDPPCNGGGGNSLLGGTGTDDDPFLLSEVVVTGNRGGGSRSSSNFGGSIHYTGGGWGNSYNETGMYGPPEPYGNPYTGNYDGSAGGGGRGSSSSWNGFVDGVSAFTFANGVKTELMGWASTMDDINVVSSKYLKFSQRLGVAGGVLQMGVSSYNIYNDYSSGGISNVNGWDVTDLVVSGGSVVAVFALGSNPVGWVVAAASGGYYLYRVFSEE